MRTRSISTIVVVFAVCALVLTGLAYAQAKPAAEVHVKGKCAVKTETKDGKEVKTCCVTVAAAKAADGKEMADLTGKVLTCTGAKATECEKLDGKECVVKGKLSADKASIEVDSAREKTEKKAEEKPAEAPAAK